ncbi:MAG: transglycosylase SLT domain-containing protein [Bacteroidales bacterium]|nr:transglycosylase SLT domain-containing protein [Bacteroidales bacterium]
MSKYLLRKKIKHTSLFYILIFVFSILVFSIYTYINPKKNSNYISPRSWKQIQKDSNLRVGILYNYTDYYVSHGEIYGFHYEMTKKLAEHLHLHITYEVYNSYNDYYIALLNNQVDLLAMDFVHDLEIESIFDYSLPHSYAGLALIQNKKTMPFNSEDSCFSLKNNKIRFIFPIHSHFKPALSFINKYYNHIILSGTDLTTDEVIRNINDDSTMISLTFNKNMHANSIFYRNIDYSYILTDPLDLHWIVRNRNDSLLIFINEWMEKFTQSKEYALLIKKYYNPHSFTRTLLKQKIQYTPFGHISSYDAIIEKYATQYELDWLLVAALIYQESKFYAHTSGGGGAYGLMQFMPSTANYWGIAIGDSPEKQIKAGCKYLKFLQKKYYDSGVKDTNQLMKFMLAAYNAGNCRIEDARIIAKKQGLDDTVWDNNVELALLMLSKKKNIRGAKLKCGSYSSGKHTINYVNAILNRYHHYKNMNY